MKRIFYNTKLKKFLITILLIVIVFQFMTPNFVFALDLFVEYEYSYNKWLEEIENSGATTTQDGFDPKSAQKGAITNECLNKIMTDIYYGVISDVEKKDKAEKLLSDRGDNLIIKGKLKSSTIASSRYPTYSFIINEIKDNELTNEELQNWGVEESGEQKYTYQEFKDFTGKNESEVDEELREPLKELIRRDLPNFTDVDKYVDEILNTYKGNIEITVTGDKNNYQIVGIEVSGLNTNELIDSTKKEIKKDSADLGGILLSPIFYLVNFIADAIISNLGRIMDPAGGSSIHGTDILVSSANAIDKSITNVTKKSDEIKVTMSNKLGSIQYPNMKYTPEEIFAGKIDLLSIDFISGKDSEGNEITGDWATIRKVIASWYRVIRMIAIIGLLSVLIYTGIKIIISANAKDKAKYKEWIINWFIAVAILFSMHYIMSFIISVINELNSALTSANQGIYIVPSERRSVCYKSNGISKIYDTI